MNEIILVLKTLVNIIIKVPILFIYFLLSETFLFVHQIGCDNYSDHLSIEISFNKFGDKIWNYGFK